MVYFCVGAFQQLFYSHLVEGGLGQQGKEHRHIRCCWSQLRAPDLGNREVKNPFSLLGQYTR